MPPVLLQGTSADSSTSNKSTFSGMLSNSPHLKTATTHLSNGCMMLTYSYVKNSYRPSKHI